MDEPAAIGKVNKNSAFDRANLLLADQSELLAALRAKLAPVLDHGLASPTTKDTGSPLNEKNHIYTLNDRIGNNNDSIRALLDLLVV